VLLDHIPKNMLVELELLSGLQQLVFLYSME